MNYAGRALENTETVPTEIKERLMAYWEFRVAAARRDEKPDEASEELSDFAWWVRSGKFENSWCLSQLKALLNYVSKFPETMFLLEDLAKVAREYPKDAATCLQLIVRQIRSDRYLYLDEQHVKQILRAALSSNVPEAIKIAESTQDDLLRLGRFEFKDLTELVSQ